MEDLILKRRVKEPGENGIDRRGFLRKLIAGGAGLGLIRSHAFAARSGRKAPNFVIIFADDRPT